MKGGNRIFINSTEAPRQQTPKNIKYEERMKTFLRELLLKERSMKMKSTACSPALRLMMIEMIETCCGTNIGRGEEELLR
jgi:hypothetical protein